MSQFLIAPFVADVTPPAGHPCMGGGISPVREVGDPLSARGFVLYGGCDPIVYCSVDWCEIRNDAYSRWREALAEAVHTTPERVLVSSVHQHDAPVADLGAEKLLRETGVSASVCDPVFHEQAVTVVANAARTAFGKPRLVTHFGTGMAKVEMVASNRRYEFDGGKIAFDRTSATINPIAQEAPDGLIDPWLRTLSFWNESEPLLALSSYAVHPMSTYGKGIVSADFPGLARTMREKEPPSVFQIYASGCSGNVTAGKYNDGTAPKRGELAARLHAAMREAWDSTKRTPLEKAEWRSAPLTLNPRESAAFSRDELTRKLVEGPRDFDRCLAAMGLSWLNRLESYRAVKRTPMDVPVVDFGEARLILLPGESYVEFQLYAQSLAPEGFVMAMGYGECATGYIPTDRHIDEGDSNLGDWCWVARGSEGLLKSAIEMALKI